MIARLLDLDPYAIFIAYTLLVGMVLAAMAIADTARERRRRRSRRARQLELAARPGGSS